MKNAGIIAALRNKLNVKAGRHLYGILGSYTALKRFSADLQQAKTIKGEPFPAPLSVNWEILKAIPDEEFKELAENEPKRPEPTIQYVKKSFEIFLRSELQKNDLLVLEGLEMLFAYHVELNLLRTLGTDDKKIILLLPGRRNRQQEIIMFSDLTEDTYLLPTNFIAENHLWELVE